MNCSICDTYYQFSVHNFSSGTLCQICINEYIRENYLTFRLLFQIRIQNVHMKVVCNFPQAWNFWYNSIYILIWNKLLQQLNICQKKAITLFRKEKIVIKIAAVRVSTFWVLMRCKIVWSYFRFLQKKTVLKCQYLMRVFNSASSDTKCSHANLRNSNLYSCSYIRNFLRKVNS